MIGFDLNEEQLGYQKFAKKFAEEEMKPYAADLDKRQGTTFDWSIVRRFAKANLLGLGVPKEYGGLGVDHLTAAVVSEELGGACLRSRAQTVWPADYRESGHFNDAGRNGYGDRCRKASHLESLLVNRSGNGFDAGFIHVQDICNGDGRKGVQSCDSDSWWPGIYP